VNLTERLGRAARLKPSKTRYDSSCYRCGGPIAIGEPCLYSPGVGVRHPGCEEGLRTRQEAANPRMLTCRHGRYVRYCERCRDDHVDCPATNRYWDGTEERSERRDGAGGGNRGTAT
jgi:hypothetical protein